tara:strand:+ start:695 stop:1018 length:324 start_codon:yes stop_codon:yes gene_type:complete
MKDSNFNKIVLVAALILAAILMMSSCVSYAKPECPVCEGCSEGEEDPYLCSKYYEDKEVPLPETGSFDFFLEEDDKITSSLIATKCLTCGIHFTHPSYGEHIKTCCP